MPDSNPPSDRQGDAGNHDGIVDETSKDEDRFNEQLMEALSDQPPSSDPPPPSDDGDAGPDSDDAAPTAEDDAAPAAEGDADEPAGEGDADEPAGEAAGARSVWDDAPDSVEEVTLSSPDVLSAETEALSDFYGGTDTYDALEDDAPNSISLETISAAALESYDGSDDSSAEGAWEHWSSHPPGDSEPPSSEPPSLRSLAGHLPQPAPLPKLQPTKDDELFDVIGPDPYNSLSESLRPPPVMKSAPELVVDDDEDEADAVPLKRQRSRTTAEKKSSPKERKERGEWVDRRERGRRRADHRPLAWPCIAFFCLGVVSTLIVQRLIGADDQPVATGPDRPGGPAARGADGRPGAVPGQDPTSHEALVGPGGAGPGTDDGPDAAAPFASGWPATDPDAVGGPDPDGRDTSATAPSASAPASTASAAGTASADTPPAEAPPFDTAAAAAALGAAAGSAASCSNGEHKGSASVAVTFAPSGRATVAVIEGGSLLGSPVASCVANMMRNAKVPAFSGGPVTVRKKVRIR